MTDIIKKVEKNILEYNLISAGDKILVGFSGGPDSTALLYSLKKLSRKYDFALAACYINHKIRPRAVKNEIEFCRNICVKLKAPFSVIEADIPAHADELKISMEEAGHRFRKDALSYMAGELGCNKIALGHHLDDLVETILFRLIRGTGPQGLNPIRPIDNNKIRPLYNISRSEIEQYLQKNKIESVLDRSNLRSKYSRNYIRNKIIPAIERHFGDRYRSSIFNFSRILTEENHFLNALAREETGKIASLTPGGKIVVDLSRFTAYDVWLKRRIIKILLERLSGRRGTGSFEDIDRIMNLPDSRIKALNLTNGINVAADRDLLIFFDRKITIEKSPLNINGITELKGVDIRIKCSTVESGKASLKKQKQGRKINIDYSKLILPLYARGIKKGDSFSPLGMTKTKKIGDYLTDKKISRYIRDEIPVLFDQKGVVWLIGHQISNRLKIDESTQKVLTIESIGNETAGIT